MRRGGYVPLGVWTLDLVGAPSEGLDIARLGALADLHRLAWSVDFSPEGFEASVRFLSKRWGKSTSWVRSVLDAAKKAGGLRVVDRGDPRLSRPARMAIVSPFPPKTQGQTRGQTRGTSTNKRGSKLNLSTVKTGQNTGSNTGSNTKDYTNSKRVSVSPLPPEGGLPDSVGPEELRRAWAAYACHLRTQASYDDHAWALLDIVGRVGLEDFLLVSRWLETSAHSRAEFLRERDDPSTALRWTNFKKYLRFAQGERDGVRPSKPARAAKKAPAKRGGKNPPRRRETALERLERLRGEQPQETEDDPNVIDV